AIDDVAARARLHDIADGFLQHDRAIHARIDDSVVRIVAGECQPIRRARGYVPDPIALGFETEPLLAVGGELQNTICITRGREAFLSPHSGDLSCADTYAVFEETARKLAGLLGVAPSAVAHDLHPDYASTRFALRSALPRIPVQHHHAHVASCLAEHGYKGPVIGIAFDGTGCGPDGSLWGGEFLLADLASYRRARHLRPLPLPGGEAAIGEPWRIGLSALLDAGESPSGFDRIPRERFARVRDLIDRDVVSPRSTGAGRWFDAIAALCALRDEITYEGQAAVELEAIASPRPEASYPFAGAPGVPAVVDLRPTVRALAADLRAEQPVPRIAARFHETMARVVAACAARTRASSRLSTVALSGGCFQSARLTERAVALLEADGFEVLVHRRVPPNDGGIALGQAAVAARR